MAATRRRRETAIATAGYSDVQPLLVFDEREFRSNLPFQLHRRGLRIIPLTLLDGDYILSDAVAVERKSVPDLCQSISSGRVMKQMGALDRRYDCPVLLIECDRKKPFRLTYQSHLKANWGDPSQRDRVLRSKLVKVLSSTTKGTICWSRSPVHSALMFQRMKETVAVENVDPADPKLTVTEARDQDSEGRIAMEILLRFPGVTRSNVSALINVAGSLAALPELSEETLTRALEETNGKILFAFLHRPFKS